MRVYRCKDGALVFAQHQKNVNKDLWPVVHWSCDEKSMYRLVSNELQVYDTSQFGTSMIPTILKRETILCAPVLKDDEIFMYACMCVRERERRGEGDGKEGKVH